MVKTIWIDTSNLNSQKVIHLKFLYLNRVTLLTYLYLRSLQYYLFSSLISSFSLHERNSLNKKRKLQNLVIFNEF